MKKFFKNFFKSKKGNMIIIVICLTPVILTVLSNTVAKNRRENAVESEILISYDAFCDYVNSKYGKVLKVNGKNTCSFSQASQKQIESYFKEYYTHVDGYNKYWSNTIEFSTNKDTNDTQYTITCVTYLPKISSSTYMVNYWGTIDASGTTTGDGWYSQHTNLLMGNGGIYKLSQLTNENKSEWQSNWTQKEIKVTSSCI